MPSPDDIDPQSGSPSTRDLPMVNPRRHYQPVRLIDPSPLGYILLAGTVEPPAKSGRPFPGKSQAKTALLERLKSLARHLESVEDVEKATVYRAVIIPPVAAQTELHDSRYDVTVLVETTSPEAINVVQNMQPYQGLVSTLTDAARNMCTINARCIRRVADVDKTRQGLFVFNYFTAEDAAVALPLWEYLAGWYATETGMDNSTLLAPMADADYVFINHARWDCSLPRFMIRQFGKRSFFNFVRANLAANRTVSMPIMYRLA